MVNPFSKNGRLAFPLPTITGKTFWVASDSVELNRLRQIFPGDEEGQTRVYEDLDSAINVAVANRGDVILVAPGHAETVATASAITADVAGLTILGLGSGADRPTLTFSGTAATMVVSGASTVIKNIITTVSIDSVVSPIVVSGADVTLDIEHRDASATVEAVRAVLTTATADNLDIKLKYVGFTAGNACVNAIRLVGGSQTRVDIDFYGVASTAVVEFHTTAVVDCNVTGYMYNSGTTDFTKSVIDTVTGSTWYAAFADGGAGQVVAGGSGEALAAGDLSSIASAVAALGTDIGDPSARTNFKTLEALLGLPDAANSSLDDMIRTGFDSSGVTPNNNGSVMELLKTIRS